MSFVAPEQKLLYGQFLLPDSVERVLEPGANFAKIFTPWSLVYTEFCGSRAEVVLRQFFLSDSVKRVLEPGA